jgi:hypothetical protein
MHFIPARRPFSSKDLKTLLVCDWQSSDRLKEHGANIRDTGVVYMFLPWGLVVYKYCGFQVGVHIDFLNTVIDVVS